MASRAPRRTAAETPPAPAAHALDGKVGTLLPLGDEVNRWAQRHSHLRAQQPAPVRCARCRDTGFVLPARVINEYCACEREQAEWQREQQAYAQMQAALAENRQEAIERKLKLPERCRNFMLESSTLVGTPVYQAVLCFLEFWDEHRGLILVGDVGTGKTGLLVGLLKRLVPLAVERNWQTRFITAPMFFVELKQGYSDGSYLSTLETYSTAHLLGLDDLGAERATDWVGEQFFLMLNARYEARLPLFATTNAAPDELTERLTPRVMDRLRETCTVVEVCGKSLRGR